MTSIPSIIQERIGSSIKIAQSKAHQAERSIWVPTKERGVGFGKTYPVSATALVLFLILSFVPIITFLSFVATIAMTVIVGSMMIVSSVVLGSIFVGSLFFVPTILFMMTLTGLVMSSLIFTFASYRLYVHLQSSLTIPEALSALQADLASLLSNEIALFQAARPIRSSNRDTLPTNPATAFKQEEEELDGFLQRAAENPSEKEEKVGEFLSEARQET
ncbi:hypothetical protein [Phaffia rhodozyma]|uniref:Uncharacterized protein n=1 Tax=Phaffia rhodozyma TaxID=264483 RepID=A0A0F7SR12_PHARH|nr:hypothetical protein [Phaffia rhodozyma]